MIALGILYVLFKFVPYREVLSLFTHSRKIFILIGFGLLFLDHILASLRWRFVLTHLGIHISAREAVYTFLSGNFFNLFFPSLIAGDAARTLLLTQHIRAPRKIAASVIMDRASGMVALSFITVIAYLWGAEIVNEPQLGIGVGVMAILGVGVLFVLFHRFFFLMLEKISFRYAGLNRRVKEFHGEFDIIRRNPSIFFKTVFIYSLIIQILNSLSFYYLAKGLFVQADMVYFFVFVPLAMLIACIPVTIAGLGTREVAMVYLFAKIGVAQPASLGMSLLNFSFLVIMSLIGGLVYVMVSHRWVQRNP